MTDNSNGPPTTRFGPCAALRAAMAGAFFLLLSGCGIGGPAYSPDRDDAAAVVEMTNAPDYAPKTITIRQGETVEWRNVSLLAHTVTADPLRASLPSHTALPDGAEPFHSGKISWGEVWQHTFITPGRYRYFCVPHEGLGMIGEVIVEPAS